MLPSFGRQVRYAHFTTKTPRQKWLRHIWLCPPAALLRKRSRKTKKKLSCVFEKSCIFAKILKHIIKW